ncbi:unnamed protein product, partial [Brassica rapa]
MYVHVTILVAAEGIHKLQPINGTADLKEALQKIGSLSMSLYNHANKFNLANEWCKKQMLQAVEVL